MDEQQQQPTFAARNAPGEGVQVWYDGDGVERTITLRGTFTPADRAEEDFAISQGWEVAGGEAAAPPEPPSPPAAVVVDQPADETAAPEE